MVEYSAQYGTAGGTRPSVTVKQRESSDVAEPIGRTHPSEDRGRSSEGRTHGRRLVRPQFGQPARRGRPSLPVRIANVEFRQSKPADHGHSSRQRPCSLAEPMTRRVPVIATEWSAYFADSLIASATDSGAAACFGSGWLRNASKPIQPMSATSEYHSASINTVSGEIRRVAVERR